MMKRLFFLILLIYGTLLSAQTDITFQNDLKGNVIVKVSIDNIINILNTPIGNFKSALITHSYNLSTTENDCYNFVKGSSFDNTIHEVSKCSGYFFSISWFNKTPNQSNLDTFIEEIEKYNVGFDSKNNMPVYQVTKGNFIYQFHVMRKPDSESVYCKKLYKQ